MSAKQNELFIVEHQSGEWIDCSGDGGWSGFTSIAEAQDALDSEADCRDESPATFKIVRFVREALGRDSTTGKGSPERGGDS